jgi:hypothetical protein
MTTSLKPFLRWLSALFTLCLGLVTQPTARAATNIVLAGEDLQARINAAASGDVMVIQSGAYGGAIAITKPLTLVRSGAGDLQLLGPVSINTAGAVAVSQLRFSDAINIEGGGAVSFSDCLVQGAIGATGGKLNMRRSEVVGGMRLTNAALTGLRLTNRIEVTAFAAPNSRIPLNLSQCTFEALLSATGYSLSVGYSKLYGFRINDGEATLVGNRVYYWDSGRTFSNETVSGYRSKLSLYNNQIRAVVVTGSGSLMGLYLESCNAKVVNNTFDINCVGSHQSICISCSGIASSVVIVGNILKPHNAAGNNVTVQRRLGFEGRMECSYCCFPPGRLSDVQFLASLETEPGYALDGTLEVGSPCRNAGPPDAIYNDRDGTRNDIGFTGGPLYNPANFTTDNPMAFWLDTTPRKVLKGVNNTIRVDAAAVAGQ